jgi:hypothetical protein
MVGVSCTTAGPLRSTGITPLHRYYWPLRHPLAVCRFPGYSGYTVFCSADFSTGRGGFLQLLNVSLSSCRRYRPARASHRISQSAAIHVAFTSACEVRPLDFGFRGNLCVHFRYGPMTRSPSHRWLCRSTPCVSFPPRMRSQLQGSDFSPGGFISHRTHQPSSGHTMPSPIPRQD